MVREGECGEVTSGRVVDNGAVYLNEKYFTFETLKPVQ